MRKEERKKAVVPFTIQHSTFIIPASAGPFLPFSRRFLPDLLCIPGAFVLY